RRAKSPAWAGPSRTGTRSGSTPSPTTITGRASRKRGGRLSTVEGRPRRSGMDAMQGTPTTRKIALVSGGSRGLGPALVSGFMQRDYGVATMSRTKTTFIDETKRGRDGAKRFHWAAVDGRDRDALRAFVA